MLKMFCDVTSLTGADSTASKAGFGCCLRDSQGLSNEGSDASADPNGGYCMRVNAGDNGFETSHLTDAEFVTATADPWDISVTALADTYPGLGTFYYDPANSDTTDFNKMTGIKAQPV